MQPPQLPLRVCQTLRSKPSGDGTAVPIKHTFEPPPRACAKQPNVWQTDHRLVYHGHPIHIDWSFIHCLHTPCSHIIFDLINIINHHTIVHSVHTVLHVVYRLRVPSIANMLSYIQNLGKFGGEIKSVPGLYASPWPCSSDAQHAVKPITHLHPLWEKVSQYPARLL